jgi:HAD superfamily hydrolase (TIGR01509 family)
MIKTLFFDLHEVITHGDFKAVYHGVANRFGVTEELVSQYHRDNLRGLLDGSLSNGHMMEALGLDISEVDFLKIWEEETVAVMTVDGRMADLLKELKSSYSLAATTNLTEQRYHADVAMGLYKYFDHQVLSFKEGSQKPEKKYFERALEITGTNPGEVIFIDDQLKNVEGAAALGIKSIRFVDYDSLVGDLKNSGVTID